MLRPQLVHQRGGTEHDNLFPHQPRGSDVGVLRCVGAVPHEVPAVHRHVQEGRDPPPGDGPRGGGAVSGGGEVLDVEPIWGCVWCTVRFFRFWVDFILILRCVLKNVLSGFEFGATIKKGVKPYSTVTVAGMRAKGLIVYVLRGGIRFPQSSRDVCFKSRSWGSE